MLERADSRNVAAAVRRHCLQVLCEQRQSSSSAIIVPVSIVHCAAEMSDNPCSLESVESILMFYANSIEQWHTKQALNRVQDSFLMPGLHIFDISNALQFCLNSFYNSFPIRKHFRSATIPAISAGNLIRTHTRRELWYRSTDTYKHAHRKTKFRQPTRKVSATLSCNIFSCRYLVLC